MPGGIVPARLAAFRILLALEKSQSAHSDDLLHSPEVDRLSPPDRHLATALVMGVLRWQIALDREISAALKRQSKLDSAVLVALRLGAFQLSFLDRVPAHAAIHDSVELTKRAGHRFASGMVNAVLRKLAGARAATSPPNEHDPVAAHPGWMVDRWRALFADEELAALCAYDQASSKRNNQSIQYRSSSRTGDRRPGA